MESLRTVKAGRRFRLQVLGSFALARDGTSLDVAGWQPRPLRLLRLLAAYGGQCSRDEVIDLLWPDSSPGAGGTNLRSLVYRLAQALGDDVPPVVLNRGRVMLNPIHEWEIDLALFEHCVGNAGDDIPALEEAVALYRGEPLQEDRYEDWATPIRDRLNRTVHSAMRRLAALYREIGEHGEAASRLERLLGLDPLDEETVRELLRTLLEAGRRTEAIRAYHRFEERLAAELDVKPDEETRVLFDTLISGAGLGADTAPVSAITSHDERLRSPTATSINLPAPATEFIGRERDVSVVISMLTGTGTRLLTLKGPGGIGKTRLALRVAQATADFFADGVYFVPLAQLTDSQFVASSIASALGLKETSRDSLADRLAARLRDKKVLLLLDNCEHVMDGVLVIGDLLRRCPGLTILATSRAVLHLSGEREHDVPALALPDESAQDDRNLLMASDAVALFLDRARAVKPDLRISDDMLLAVALVCRRLDGLPLAIELAAARVRLFPPRALLHRLHHRLPVLTDGARDAPARQQTMRETIDWSYRLLNNEERTVFARLAVFAGGWTLDAARSVCILPEDDAPDVLRILTSLVEKSLVQQVDTSDPIADEAIPRFTMLETIREYAAEHLEESGEEAEISRHHALYFLDLVQRADPELIGPEQFAWFERLEVEHDNVREALTWANMQAEIDIGLRLSCSFFWFWYGRGYWSEARETLEQLLQAADAPSDGDLLAEALCKSGGFAWLLGDFGAARPEIEKSIVKGRDAGNDQVVALALVFLGSLALWEGDSATSIRLEEEALVIARDAGYEIAVALALFNLGVGAMQNGECGVARQRLGEALAVWRRMGDQWGIALGLNSLGDLARAEAEYDRAAAYYDECLRLSNDFGIKDLRGSLLHNLGHVAHVQGDNGRAAALFREALSLFNVLGDRRGEAECLVGLAASIAPDAAELAARLFGAASMSLEEIGAQLHPANRGEYERNLAVTLALCGAETFQTAWEEGRRMTERERLACALSGGE